MLFFDYIVWDKTFGPLVQIALLLLYLLLNYSQGQDYLVTLLCMNVYKTLSLLLTNICDVHVYAINFSPSQGMHFLFSHTHREKVIGLRSIFHTVAQRFHPSLNLGIHKLFLCHGPLWTPSQNIVFKWTNIMSSKVTNI